MAHFLELRMHNRIHIINLEMVARVTSPGDKVLVYMAGQEEAIFTLTKDQGKLFLEVFRQHANAEVLELGSD